MEVEEGEEVVLECQSQGAKPPAEIQWWDGDGKRIVSDVTEHVARMENDKKFKTVSTLRFKPRKGQHIKCSAHNDIYPIGKMSNSLEIAFKGQPKKEVTELEDGDSVKIFCNNEKITRDRKFKWFINDVEIFDETKNVLEIQQFTKSYDKSVVKCSVTDEDNTDEVIRVVELVHKQPDVSPVTQRNILQDITRSKKSSARKKKTTKNVANKKKMFTCIMEDDGDDTSSEPKYVWIDGRLKEVNLNEAVDASNQDKRYKCKVIPKGMKKITKMSRDLKSLTKTLKKFSRTLTEITSIPDT